MSTIRIYVKDPGEDPRPVNISNTLEALQNFVRGYVEIVRLSDQLVMIINEDGHQLGMFRNFDFLGSTVYGPAIFAGIDGEQLASVTPEALQDMPA